ncbi:TetR/AcrR family transcriptional regulator [Devosia sp. XK-2]|uniref:TetR/AcrR family transcriptional regulator n=1 Tax=Devosia sp. XK-2 TaxID=3126689 RepID=UPI0030CEAE43
MNTLSNTAQEILLHAKPLILAGGYHGFSYADISDLVGIRKASIHHHFPTKAELVRVLVNQYRQDAAAGLAQLDRTIADPGARLRAYVAYWQTCISSGTEPFCVCALLASQMPAIPDIVAIEVRAHFRTLSVWLATVLAEGEASGRFRLAGEPKAEAELFVATVHGAMMSARAHADGDLFEKIIGPLVERMTLKGPS